jgi:TolB protein
VRRVGGLLAVLCLAWASPAQSQDPGDVRLGITYTPGFVPGLVMTPLESDGTMATVAASIDSIVRRDLAFSDRFEIIPVPDGMGGGGPVNYGLWDQLGAVWLVTGAVSGSDRGPVLRLSLHDVVFGELKEVRAFTLAAVGDADFRMSVHRASDEIVRWATGDPGIAASRIVFRRNLDATRSDIFMIDSDGSGLRRLTRDTSIVLSPTLSPDGSGLLYVSYRSGEASVYEKNLRTGGDRTIATGGLNITPVYSPDGRSILFGKTVGTHTELFRMQRNPLCCSERMTYTSAGDAMNASFAPDGRRIAFTASPLVQPHVYVMTLGGSNPQIISRYVYGERGYATSPDWSPRGERIAYQGWLDNTFQIIAANPDGSDRRVLTSSGRNEDPSWAPDGRHLVFASNRQGYNALWILDTVTGRIRSLTVNNVDQLPDWSDAIPAP